MQSLVFTVDSRFGFGTGSNKALDSGTGSSNKGRIRPTLIESQFNEAQVGVQCVVRTVTKRGYFLLHDAMTRVNNRQYFSRRKKWQLRHCLLLLQQHSSTIFWQKKGTRNWVVKFNILEQSIPSSHEPISKCKYRKYLRATVLAENIQASPHELAQPGINFSAF